MLPPIDGSPLPRLMEEISQLNTKLHELNVSHYHQVVDARESLNRCSQVSKDLQLQVDEANELALPRLRSNLTTFQEIGRQICTQHKSTLLMIDLNAGLTDLLSIPSLMDTCARSGAVEEALELCNLAKTLRTRHDAISELKQGERGAGIIRRLAEEVERSALQLRKQLLAQLRGSIDLPTCLRLLSHLKRLDLTMNLDNSLQQEFLQARDAYLQNQSLLLVDHHNDLPYQTCLKQIQKNREVWFDVITQFQAVFGSNALLARWIRERVSKFLHTLQFTYANKFENCGEIGTVYELCSSFAASLARVGADFRPLVQPIFIARAREICTSAWESAGAAALQSLSQGEFGTSSLLTPAILSSGEEGEDLSPSPQLLQLPVLVDLVNALLRSFNDLRSFACLNMAHELAKELLHCLDLAVQGLEAFASKSKSNSGGEEEEERRFQLVLDLFPHRVLLYVSRCFAATFDWKKPVHALIDTQALAARVKRLTTSTTPVSPHRPSVPASVTTPKQAPRFTESHDLHHAAEEEAVSMENEEAAAVEQEQGAAIEQEEETSVEQEQDVADEQEQNVADEQGVAIDQEQDVADE